MSGVPGQKLNIRQIQLVAVCTLCLVLSTGAICLRMLARRISTIKFWWDDAAAILSLVICWVANITPIIGVRYGLGRHVSEVEPSNITPFGVNFWIHQLTWTLSVGITIFAILLFYVRLFPQKWMRWMRWSVYGLFVWTAAWTISTVGVMARQCQPAEYLWDRKIKNAKCINSNAMYFSVGITSALTILAVLLLPLPIIYNLQTSRNKKIGLFFSFSAGAFVLITSVVRLIVLFQISHDDLTYTTVPAQLWSSVEASFGIVGACMPSLTPLFHMAVGKHSHSRRQSAESKFRNGSGSTGSKRRSAIPDFEVAASLEPPSKAATRESALFQNPTRRSPDDDLLKDIEDTYPGIVVTHEIDQEFASRSDSMNEQTLDS